MSDMMSVDARGFSTALMGLCNQIDGSVEKVIRKACFDLYKAIVDKTPVDTGRAKGSWGVGTQHSPDVLPPGDYGDNPTLGMVGDATAGLFTFQLQDEQVVIYNNLEYIEALEGGSSQQAPAGMVSISLAEFEAHFNAALATEPVLN